MKVSNNELSSVVPILAAYDSLITERKDKTRIELLPYFLFIILLKNGFNGF